ncbi:hypothetical protein [Streptomyces sp. NPDC057682]|uniref:hypothetical protein n=1 Tax=Streptomyces sp. NPDC057682 TaxID=3346210 RepID=UPI00367D745E
MTSLDSRRRKRGWLAGAVCAAVLATGAGVAVASSVSAAPLASTPAVVSHPAAAPTGSVRVVTPGERISVADRTLWLTPKGLNVAAPSSATPSGLNVAEVLPGKVATLSEGDASGALWAGIYRGPVTSTTKVALTFGTRTLQAEVVTLAGKPGWGAYYVFDAKGAAGAKPSISVRSR